LPNASSQIEAGLVRDTVPVHDETSVVDGLLMRLPVGLVQRQRRRLGLAARAENDAVPLSLDVNWEGLISAELIAGETPALTSCSQLKAVSYLLLAYFSSIGAK
jgi:hypothetical protein